MTRGGARNRSGPAPDPQSRTSERRGYVLTALPNEGYQDDPPAFPLRQRGDDKTKMFARRERSIWAEAWRTPQACAWSMESWRWPVIAEYCRLKAAVEYDPAASAALVGQLHRYRDQIGLTPAGMRDNGWKIAPNELGAKRAEKDQAEDQAEPAPPAGTPRSRRLR